MSRSKNISSPSSAGRARLGFRFRSPIICDYEELDECFNCHAKQSLISLQRHLGPLLLLDFLTLTRAITSLTGDEQTWITQLAF